MFVNNIENNIVQSDSNGQNKVGVVIVNWNDLENTRDCLKSLLNQRYRDLEIIVIDNGSKDGSADLLQEEFQGLTIIRLSENTGFVGGNNYGIRIGLKRKCSYFLLLNNDTVVDSNLIGEMIKVTSSNPRCGIVTPKIYYFEKPNRIQSAGSLFSLWSGIAQMRGRKNLDYGQFDKVEEVPYGSGCALLIKTELINSIGLMDEVFFAYAEDIDWSIRARNAGYSILYAPLAKVWHKEDFGWRKKHNQSLRFYLSSRNGLLLMHKHGKWFQWFSFVPNYLINWIGRFIIIAIFRKDGRSALAALEGIIGFWRIVKRNQDWFEKEKLIIEKYSKA